MNQRSKVFLFFLIVFILRLIFSFSIGLIDDEAYHWSWAKEASLSYFDHPAMIAWMGWFTTLLFGDTIFAVRLISVLGFCGSCFLLWKITRELFDESSAFFATTLILFSPFFGFGGYVSSPEQPFMFFWLLGVYVFWKYVSDQWSIKKSWIILGFVMGAGLNSKFIIATLAFGFGTFMIADAKKRKDLLSIWPWTGFAIASLLSLPIFIWNVQYDWPGFKYQFHDRHQGGGFSLERWFVFFLAQVVFLTPAVYVLTVSTWTKGILRRHELRWKFLVCLTLPTLLIFYTQPFFADYKPHWSGAAYLTLFMGAGFVWSQSKHRKKITLAVLAFFIPINIVIYSPFIYPWWPKMFRWLAPDKQWQTTYDLSNEFHGWEELGQRLLDNQKQIDTETGDIPFLASHRYETTAQTYWGARQKTYMLATAVSNYTVVQRSELVYLMGKNALFVTTEKYPGNPMDFAKWNSCTPEKFDFYRSGELSRQFTIWYCQNFQGIL
ncbi:MAG: ArnT family glycosyltransferase [Pseudobdellovibrionaceae bacterium]